MKVTLQIVLELYQAGRYEQALEAAAAFQNPDHLAERAESHNLAGLCNLALGRPVQDEPAAQLLQAMRLRGGYPR